MNVPYFHLCFKILFLSDRDKSKSKTRKNSWFVSVIQNMDFQLGFTFEIFLNILFFRQSSFVTIGTCRFWTRLIVLSKSPRSDLRLQFYGFPNSYLKNFCILVMRLKLRFRFVSTLHGVRRKILQCTISPLWNMCRSGRVPDMICPGKRKCM